MAAWTLLTCEYPPGCGGVGDYTAQLAGALAAAGDEVHVFTPPQPVTPLSLPGVTVTLLADRYGSAARAQLDRWLDSRSSTVVAQYVPTAFGLKGANVPWCRWLRARSMRPGADVRVMFHEPYFQYGWKPLHQTPLSIVQRHMARLLVDIGSAAYISTDSWRPYLSRYSHDGARRPFVTLPIPSTIPRSQRADVVADRRRSLLASSGGSLIGHFGTYGTHVAPMVRAALPALLERMPEASAVCIGGGSIEFVKEMSSIHPAIHGRLHATGRLESKDAADAIAACDLMLQPFPDGVTTRRTSVMAGLNNARPVLSTTGHLTERVWDDTGAVSMTAAGDDEAYVRAAEVLIADRAALAALGARGDAAYRTRFAIEHTVAALKGS